MAQVAERLKEIVGQAIVNGHSRGDVLYWLNDLVTSVERGDLLPDERDADPGEGRRIVCQYCEDDSDPMCGECGNDLTIEWS